MHLTPRQIEILKLIDSQRSITNAEIARQQMRSVFTIKHQLLQIYNRLGVDRKLAAVMKAKEMGLI